MLIVLKIIFLSLLTNGVTQVSEDEGEEGNKGGEGRGGNKGSRETVKKVLH